MYIHKSCLDDEKRCCSIQNCPFCKSAYYDDEPFCPGCGRRIVEYRYCCNKYCDYYNEILSDNQDFCPHCGVPAGNVYGGEKQTPIWSIILGFVIVAVILFFLWIVFKGEPAGQGGGNVFSTQSGMIYTDNIYLNFSVAISICH